jgi:hypothetical protein
MRAKTGDLRRQAEALRQVALVSGDADASRRVALLEEGVALARAAGAPGQTAVQLAFLAAAAAEAADTERAQELLDESYRLARAAGDAWSLVQPTAQLGWMALADGRLVEAESHFKFVRDLTAGWGGNAPIWCIGLGQVSLRRGELEQALALHRQALFELHKCGASGVHLADALMCLASVEAAADRPERAQRLVGARNAWYALHDGVGRIWLPTSRAPLKRGLVHVPDVADDVDLAQARAEGCRMSLDEAVAYALDELASD